MTCSFFRRGKNDVVSPEMSKMNEKLSFSKRRGHSLCSLLGGEREDCWSYCPSLPRFSRREKKQKMVEVYHTLCTDTWGERVALLCVCVCVCEWMGLMVVVCWEQSGALRELWTGLFVLNALSPLSAACEMFSVYISLYISFS